MHVNQEQRISSILQRSCNQYGEIPHSVARNLVAQNSNIIINVLMVALIFWLGALNCIGGYGDWLLDLLSCISSMGIRSRIDCMLEDIKNGMV